MSKELSVEFAFLLSHPIRDLLEFWNYQHYV